jgi:hypothetical protein
LRWAAERFYWAVLDVPLRRPGPLPPGLLLELQDHLPLDVQSVHAVGAPLAPSDAGAVSRTLVCAALHDELRTVPGDAASLCPAGVPAGVAFAGDLDHLNLLVGDFEPRPRRRRRARAHAAAMIGVLGVCGLLAVGFARRADAAQRHVNALTSSGTLAAITDADLAVLRALAEKAAAEPAPVDAAVTLAAVLRAWPAGGAVGGAGGGVDSGPAEVQTLTVDSRRVALTVAVDGDPGAFLAGVRPPAGTTLEQPIIGTASGNKARVALTFTRAAPAGPQGVRP